MRWSKGLSSLVWSDARRITNRNLHGFQSLSWGLAVTDFAAGMASLQTLKVPKFVKNGVTSNSVSEIKAD